MNSGEFGCGSDISGRHLQNGEESEKKKDNCAREDVSESMPRILSALKFFLSF